MTAIIFLMVQAGLSFLASMLVLWVMAKPLKGFIQLLCPVEASAEFWTQYTRVMLTLAPMLLVLLVNLWVPEQDVVIVLRYTFLVVVAGLLLGMYLVGRRLMRAAGEQRLI